MASARPTVSLPTETGLPRADRSELKMTQQAYTGLPSAVPFELAAAVLALLYGEKCACRRGCTYLPGSQTFGLHMLIHALEGCHAVLSGKFAL